MRTVVVLLIGTALGAGVCYWKIGELRSDVPVQPASSHGVPVEEFSHAVMRKIRIGFSCPGAERGWLVALRADASRAAKGLEDVELLMKDASMTTEQQVVDVGELLRDGVDALVVLPHVGEQLLPVCSKARRSGVPLINVGPRISSEDFHCHVDGDNYGIGVAAARFIGEKLERYGKVVEVTGTAGLPITHERSRGFRETIAAEFPGIKLVDSESGEFLADRALIVTENLLEEHSRIDAIYSHDDEMNVGVLQAVIAAGREEELFITGVGGSKWAMRQIQEGESPVQATFLYSPSMAGCAVRVARLAVLGSGFAELGVTDVPRRIKLQPTVVTRENVESFLLSGY